MYPQTKEDGKPGQPSSKDLIEITTVPPPGGGPGRRELIAGLVAIENPTRYRIVIFSHTDLWYVQPFVAAPFTDTDSKGKWQTRIHLGDEYAALLVKPSYDPPSTAITLPRVGGDVVAIARAAARK